MKSRGTGNSGGSSYNTDTPPFAVPDLADEMDAYDGLSPRLRRAIDRATREFSAVQARQMIDAGSFAGDDELASLIEAQTKLDHETRRKEIGYEKAKTYHQIARRIG